MNQLGRGWHPPAKGHLQGEQVTVLRGALPATRRDAGLRAGAGSTRSAGTTPWVPARLPIAWNSLHEHEENAQTAKSLVANGLSMTLPETVLRCPAWFLYVIHWRSVSYAGV